MTVTSVSTPQTTEVTQFDVIDAANNGQSKPACQNSASKINKVCKVLDPNSLRLDQTPQCSAALKKHFEVCGLSKMKADAADSQGSAMHSQIKADLKDRSQCNEEAAHVRKMCEKIEENGVGLVRAQCMEALGMVTKHCMEGGHYDGYPLMQTVLIVGSHYERYGTFEERLAASRKSQ
jgi:hypothetical protein